MHMFSYTEICFIGISMEDVHFSECGIFPWDDVGHIMVWACISLPELLARDRLELLIRQWTNLRVPHNDSRARIPPENRIVIAGRAQNFRAFEVLHCFPECVKGERGTARPALAKMGVRASL